MHENEPTPAPPEEAPQAEEAPRGPVAAEQQDEIDKLCAGVAADLRSCLEQFAAASRAREARAVAEARADGLELLAQAIGRIRAEQSVPAAAAALIDACALFCGRAVLLIHQDGKMSGFHAAGGGARPSGDALRRLTFDAASAAAVERAIVEREIVAATGAAADLSAEAAAALGYGESDRVLVYPLRLRGKALAVVLIDESEGAPIESAAVEALIAAGEAWLEAVGARRKIAAAA